MMVLERLEWTIQNPNHPNTKHENLWYSNGFSIRMFGIRASTVYSGDLNNGNIWETNFYLSSIQFGIKMILKYLDHNFNSNLVFKWWSTGLNLVPHSNTGTIWRSDNFWQFEYQTSPVFRSPMYALLVSMNQYLKSTDTDCSIECSGSEWKTLALKIK